MRILADQCVNLEVVEHIRLNGFDISHTSQVGLSRATDEAIFNYAIRHHRVLLSFDKDFGNIIQFPIRNSYGVVLIYIDGMTRKEIIQKTLNCFNVYFKDSIRHNRLFIVEKDQIRIWPK